MQKSSPGHPSPLLRQFCTFRWWLGVGRPGNEQLTDAKKRVTDLFDDLGYDAYDVGPLSEGWRYQRDTAAYASLYAPEGSGWPPPAGRQVTTNFLKEKLDTAVRYADM